MASFIQGVHIDRVTGDRIPSMNPSEDDRTGHLSEQEAYQGKTFTRWAAGAVLLLSMPMLLGSLGALLLFYLSPERFNALLTRLPGDQFIRSSLAFAPASLFAVVILATLYILERPREPALAPELEPTQPGAAVRARSRREALLKWSFRLAVAAFLGSTFTLLLSFVAPGRFWDLLSFLPGQQYIRWLVQIAPGLAFLWLVGTRALSIKSREVEPLTARPFLPFSRFTVGLVLSVSIPLFLASVAALGLFYLSPERFEALLLRISEGSFLRLTLISAPALLLAVVLLAGLYLLGRSWESPPVSDSSERLGEGLSKAAAGILIVGLLISAAIVLGLLGVIFVLILR